MAIVGLGAAANGVGTPGSAFTVSYTLAAGSDRLVTASTAWTGTVDITGVDFGGVAMVLLATTTQGTVTTQMWGLLDAALPANGTFDITVQGSSGGNTASITCGAHQGVSQHALPQATAGGGTAANVNHDISVFIHNTGDFVFWGMTKNEGTAYTDGECPVGTTALQINTNFPTGATHRVSRSNLAVGSDHTTEVARCIDADVATNFAGIAVLMREAYTFGVDPTVLSSAGPQTSTGTTNTLATTLGAGSNRLALLFVQTTGNQRVTSVTYGGQTAALVTDGTLTAETIIDSGADDLVVSVFVVKEANLPANGAQNWVTTLNGSQPCITETFIVQDAEQGDLAGLSIASDAAGVSPLVDFGGALVDFPHSLAFATVGSVQ